VDGLTLQVDAVAAPVQARATVAIR